MDFQEQYIPGFEDFWNPDPGSVNEYEMSSSLDSISTDVQFLNIDDSTVVYKYQSRVRKEAKQRLKNAEIQILVTTPYDIRTIKVWIQREEKAADLFAYDVGRVAFAARDIVFKRTQPLQNMIGTESLFEVDLDSIYYDNPYDKRPVYKLAKTDMLNRNRFQVVVQVVFRDGSLSGEFTSPSFYCCTQPKSNTKRKGRSTNDDNHYTNKWNEPSDIYNNNQSVDFFEAREAVIGHLKVKCKLQSPESKADIAYHFDVHRRESNKCFTEGDVVGLKTKENGKTSIIELSSKIDMRTIMQVGVISRSAFFEGNIPAEKELSTETICIMGIIKVNIVGNARDGERVYASTRYPGKALVESHSSHVDDDILLGITMESSNVKHQQKENLVRCFISFLCGINAKHSYRKVQEQESRTDAKIEKAVLQKCRELKEKVMNWCMIFAFLTILFCIILWFSI